MPAPPYERSFKNLTFQQPIETDEEVMARPLKP
jgi:hypothetical protein